MPFVTIIPRDDLLPEECRELGNAILQWRNTDSRILSIDDDAIDELRNGRQPTELPTRLLAKLRGAPIPQSHLPEVNEIAERLNRPKQEWNGVFAYIKDAPLDDVLNSLDTFLPRQLLCRLDIQTDDSAGSF